MRDTSIAAANSIADSVDQMRARVFVEIRERGGATCDEVEVALEFRHQTASARIRELTVEGKIYDSGERRTTRSGRKAVVWREKTDAVTLPAIDSFSGEFRFLSNFWPVKIQYEGAEYASTEHAYQAAKTLDAGMRKIVAEAPTASRAKRAGRFLHLRPDWEQVKLSVMEEVLRSKFAQPDLRTRLLATAGRQLVEGNTWGDTFWGVCGGRGENHLGRLLMQLREELSESTRSLDPVLKWAGSKRWALPRLQELYTQCGRPRLVEPFTGSAAVALGLRPTEALLRDANPHLVNLYRWLQRGLVVSNIEMKNDEAHYYARRDDLNALVEAEQLDTQTGAELFYYLNRTCFNGLCRFNRDGKFNVPFGKYKKINYRTDFTEYKAVLAGWQFEHQEIVKGDAFRKGDFLYLDPPYDCDFVDYSAGGFSWEQQIITAEVGAAHEGPVVASNACTARVLNLYRRLGYDVDVVAAPRSISSSGDRGAVLEMLATKNLTRRCG